MNWLGLFNYWVVVGLMMIGFYTVIARRNLIKKVIGLNIFQVAVYITMGVIRDSVAPMLSEGVHDYINPLPTVLILTAIVVGVATTAVALALILRIQDACGTVEEHELQELDDASRSARWYWCLRRTAWRWKCRRTGITSSMPRTSCA